MSRIIAGSRRRPAAGHAAAATGPGRPPTGSARRCSPRSRPGPAPRPAGRAALAGLAFCDLYAGSGAVGLEAASRGAAPVLLVEADADGRVTGRNVVDLGLAADVRSERVEQLVRRPAGRGYDVVFADPPYELDAAALDDQSRPARRRTAGWPPDGLLVRRALPADGRAATGRVLSTELAPQLR